MQVCVLSAPRSIEYLTQTVDDLFLRAPSLRASHVSVFRDGLDCPQVVADKVARVHLSSPERLEYIRSRKTRGTLNWIRLLKSADGKQGFVCVLEDDLVFASDWYNRARNLARAAYDMSPRMALVLSWYYPLNEFSRAGAVGKDAILRWRFPEKYYGTQGTIFPCSLAHEIADRWQKELDRTEVDAFPPSKERYTLFTDMALRHFWTDYKIDLFASLPCLVQHVGNQSSLSRKGNPPIFYVDVKPKNQYFDAPPAAPVAAPPAAPVAAKPIAALPPKRRTLLHRVGRRKTHA